MPAVTWAGRVNSLVKLFGSTTQNIGTFPDCSRSAPIRLTWDDGCPVNLYFTAKGKDKSHVSVQHGKLERKTDVDRVKAFWGKRLGALAEMLVKK